MRIRPVPTWLREYPRAWLGHDLIAGVVIWSVVVPQAVAYAGIAGLPPEAGLAAAPGALVAYALLGSSRTLVVSATTATSAVSAAAVGPLAGHDSARFAALSAGLALATALVLVGAGLLRLGRLTDLVSSPVMTGFLFGLGLTVALGQVPDMLGVEGSGGHAVAQLRALVPRLGQAHPLTLAVALGSVGLLVVLGRLVPKLPATLIVLVLAIGCSAAFGFAGHGVDVVGRIPSGVPHPGWPDVTWGDLARLLPAAFGMLVVSAEAVSVSGSIAKADGYQVDPNRDLVAIGGSNLLAGLSQGFVQSGGASQTMAAERAGGKSQLGSLVAAGLILLTGAFLAPLFTDLPRATLGAIVVVAIAGFFRVDRIRRFARIRRSALVFSVTALAGVLVLGVLAGLIVTAGLSLIVVIRRLSRPTVVELSRAADTGIWTADGPGRTPGRDVLVVRVEGPLFYANAESVQSRVLAVAAAADPRPRTLVLDIGASWDLDVESADSLAELAAALRAYGIEMRLAEVRGKAAGVIARAGGLPGVGQYATVDSALEPDGPDRPDRPDGPRGPGAPVLPDR